MRFGVHISVGAGFPRAVQQAQEIGCETIQIFSGNPRGWKNGPVPQPEGAQFRAALEAAGIHPLVVHAIYLINLASPQEELRRKSVKAFAELLARCVALGAEYVVLHPGSHGGQGPEAGAEFAGAGLREAWEAAGRPEAPVILLENVAGGGQTLGASPAQLAAIRAAAGEELGGRLGLCLDSCHAFAAGYDLRGADGWRRLLDEASASWGPGAVRVLHANDSAGELGSHRDRHLQPGDGALGENGFRAMLRQPELWDVPAIVETPQEDPDHPGHNLRLLKELWENVAP